MNKFQLGIIIIGLTVQQPTAAYDMDIESDDDLYMQVPLKQTEIQRKKLMHAIIQNGSFNLRDIYEKYIGEVGANGAIWAVETASNNLCHDRAHDLGKVIYARLGQIGKALRTCQKACFSGCMHGVLMEAFTIRNLDEPHGEKLNKKGTYMQSTHIESKDVRAQIKDICSDETMAHMYKYGDCIHGVGHALMYLANYDIYKAINYCKLFDKAPDKYYCATGAYMQYVNTHDKNDLHNRSIFYPCGANEYPAACFRYKMVRVVPRHLKANKPFSQLYENCLGQKGKYRLGCFHGLGNATSYLVVKNMVKLSALCSVGDVEDQHMCIEGVIERTAKFYPKAAKKACLTLDGWQRNLCYQGVKNGMYSFEKNFELYLRDE